jgi:hypothetical protein
VRVCSSWSSACRAHLDALPVGLGGGAGVGAEAFQLGEQPGLSGGDAGQLGGQVCLLALAGGLLLGGGGRDEVGEHGGAVVAEYPLVQEPGDGGHDRLVPDGCRVCLVVGVGGDVAGVGGVVGAVIVGVDRARVCLG